MVCPTCGAQNSLEAAHCHQCGMRMAPTAASVPRDSGGDGPPNLVTLPVTYAGFWKRLAAWFIDRMILWLPIIPFGILSWGLGEAHSGWRRWGHSDFEGPAACLMWFVWWGLSWAYYAGFENSSYQATPGKMALGIIVTDLRGQRVSFARATGRYFGRFLSSATLGIGFLMVGFTGRRQGLHDLVAECVVIRKPGAALGRFSAADAKWLTVS